MSRDKHIEEMAKDVEQARIKASDTTNSMNYGFGGWYAKELYAKGYRKTSDIVRGIFAEIEELLKAHKIAVHFNNYDAALTDAIDELKKKYTEGANEI